MCLCHAASFSSSKIGTKQKRVGTHCLMDVVGKRTTFGVMKKQLERQKAIL